MRFEYPCSPCLNRVKFAFIIKCESRLCSDSLGSLENGNVLLFFYLIRVRGIVWRLPAEFIILDHCLNNGFMFLTGAVELQTYIVIIRADIFVTPGNPD